MKWIKAFALENAPKPTPDGKGVAVVELDEMWHFLKKSLTKSGYGKLIVQLQDTLLTGNAGNGIEPRLTDFLSV
jgi:hypothetical protein